VGEYRDALGELAPSEESRVLEEEYRDVGMKVVQERMKVRRLILLVLAGVMLLVRYRDRPGTILTLDGKPDKRRPEADAPASFDVAGAVSSLAEGV